MEEGGEGLGGVECRCQGLVGHHGGGFSFFGRLSAFCLLFFFVFFFEFLFFWFFVYFFFVFIIYCALFFF